MKIHSSDYWKDPWQPAVPIAKGRLVQLHTDLEKHKKTFAEVYSNGDVATAPLWGQASRRQEPTRFMTQLLSAKVNGDFKAVDMDCGHNFEHRSGLTIKVRTTRKFLLASGGIEVVVKNEHPSNAVAKNKKFPDVLLMIQYQVPDNEQYFTMACIQVCKLKMDLANGQYRDMVHKSMKYVYDKVHTQWDWLYEFPTPIQVRVGNGDKADALVRKHEQKLNEELMRLYNASAIDKRILFNDTTLKTA